MSACKSRVVGVIVIHCVIAVGCGVLAVWILVRLVVKGVVDVLELVLIVLL